GAEYLYGLIAQFFGPDHTAAIEDPSYEKIRKVYESVGMPVELLKMTPSGIASKDLKQTKAAILHVTPFNSYPSGVTVGISKKIEYLKWAGDNNGIVIEDNYDSELTVSKKPEEPLFSMDPEGRVIYINTFSRTLAPSMRIGYMILPGRLSSEFEKKLGFYSCTVPVLDQYVLCELLKSGEYERHINRIRRKRRG
ncbi:MAG: PLP-dependent aminotransferase family protein, partial [Lachnospiraceae bacterium]|nr:PLP-dependent aminotransferase family protein [Lachnospiraceae bacterium]